MQIILAASLPYKVQEIQDGELAGCAVTLSSSKVSLETQFTWAQMSGCVAMTI